jgi:hypothetical protein
MDQAILTYEIEKEREDFLNWISSQPFEDTHDRIHAKKHTGTGDWLIQEPRFRSWLN